MTVTPTDRPKSARNRFVIEVFVASLCFLLTFISDSTGAFVVGLGQISSFCSLFSNSLPGISLGVYVYNGYLFTAQTTKGKISLYSMTYKEVIGNSLNPRSSDARLP